MTLTGPGGKRWLKPRPGMWILSAADYGVTLSQPPASWKAAAFTSASSSPSNSGGRGRPEPGVREYAASSFSA